MVNRNRSRHNSYNSYSSKYGIEPNLGRLGYDEVNIKNFFKCLDKRLEKYMIVTLSELEREVLDCMEAHQYKIRISECAKELGITVKEVESAIKSLEEKSLLKKKV